MIPRLAALVLLLTLVARPAAACPEPSQSLLFHSCWGAAQIEIALVPDDLSLPEPPADGLRLIITGAYTGTETRTEGRPKPVGLFLRRGEVVNPNLGRMDGVLVVDPDAGQPRFQHRERVALGSRAYDLTDLEQRRAFIRAAAAKGLSVMQSHLLVDGHESDVAPQDGAPVFTRRLLFADAEGFGVWQSQASMTLHEATNAILRSLGPRMAMNLDMGSYDFCRRAAAGTETNCGRVAPEGVGKLSNVLVLTLE